MGCRPAARQGSKKDWDNIETDLKRQEEEEKPEGEEALKCPLTLTSNRFKPKPNPNGVLYPDPDRFLPPQLILAQT